MEFHHLTGDTLQILNFQCQDHRVMQWSEKLLKLIVSDEWCINSYESNCAVHSFKMWKWITCSVYTDGNGVVIKKEVDSSDITKSQDAQTSTSMFDIWWYIICIHFVSVWHVWCLQCCNVHCFVLSLRWTSYVAPNLPKGGGEWKTQNVFFGVKLHFAWRKSAIKFLCVKTVRHSLAWLSMQKWLLGVTPSTWNIGWNWPCWSEIVDFRSLFARSASALTPREKAQLTLIGSPLRAFQWAPDEHCTLP